MLLNLGGGLGSLGFGPASVSCLYQETYSLSPTCDRLLFYYSFLQVLHNYVMRLMIVMKLGMILLLKLYMQCIITASLILSFLPVQIITTCEVFEDSPPFWYSSFYINLGATEIGSATLYQWDSKYIVYVMCARNPRKIRKNADMRIQDFPKGEWRKFKTCDNEANLDGL